MTYRLLSPSIPVTPLIGLRLGMELLKLFFPVFLDRTISSRLAVADIDSSGNLATVAALSHYPHRHWSVPRAFLQYTDGARRRHKDESPWLFSERMEFYQQTLVP